ncbi:TetR/AcrR family transcriptional regulator [Paenibacillus sp. HN-1]|uniref:TetR/AcrR family transcriptional regulator n=1 Tax=Paenibacillus TaxID=44249 RepID=UPI001CA840B2|nr:MULTISPECIES: TetR/AcrR family transcriptional regulator [Paenibacillus]MBY9082503.1 TetR/AcrR family transcriptional regulator [Paenibacillus sp. CGMCC 1.18879]MBY9084862.1 TetR/AcrR family transcriptional regulator [Paenibacillus sinensis]
MRKISEHKHAAILDAAYEVFGAEGFHEAKISQVAELAGIAKGTVYLYFSSKEELFMAVTRRDCDEFLNGLRDRLDGLRDLSGCLSLIAGHHLMYYYERKRHTKLFFRTSGSSPELIAYMASFIKDYMEVVMEVLMQAGTAEPQLMAQAFIGSLDRLKMDILLEPSFTEEDVVKRAEFAAGLFLRGAGCGTGMSSGEAKDGAGQGHESSIYGTEGEKSS